MKPAANKAKKKSDNLSQQVIEFLQEQPDFLDKNPELLANMTISHDSGVAISLLERQVKVLREQSIRDRAQLKDLIGIARENDHSHQRMHQLIINLLRVQDTDELFNQLQEDMRERFNVNTVRLKLFDSNKLEELESKHEAVKQLNHFFRTRQPVCGRLTQAQLTFLFEQAADTIQSAALIPIYGKHQTGILSLGSDDEQRFSPAQGTQLLLQIGEIVSSRFLDLESR